MLSTTFRNLCAVFRYVAFIRRRCARGAACLILRPHKFSEMPRGL
jgi:hypothetical protein